MYQTVGHQAIELYAEAMDLPLYRRTIQGSSLDTSRNYSRTEGDEVEDLFELLQLVKVVILFFGITLFFRIAQSPYIAPNLYLNIYLFFHLFAR